MAPEVQDPKNCKNSKLPKLPVIVLSQLEEVGAIDIHWDQSSLL